MAEQPNLPDTDAQPEPELSMAEHEAQFGASSASAPTPAETPTAPGEPTAAADADRDEKGKFVAKSGHRAKSHQAGVADVPRIAELTRKLREAEAERDALKTRPAETPRPTPPVAEFPQPAAPAAAVQKPQLKDFTDYDEYLDAREAWNRGETMRQWREEQRSSAEAQRLTTSWRTKVEAAKTNYDDFEQVALLAPTNIPPGSLVDAWILEHKAGAHVLYHLQKNPQDLSALLALPVLDQADSLSQLALRLSPVSTRAAAATTGAAPTTPVSPGPRPPTPVRTAPMRAADEPPGDDATLADHEKYFGQRQRRR